MKQTMSVVEFEELYTNGYARTVKEFLRYFDRDEAEEYAQDVYAAIWENRHKWDRKFSAVLFWHLQLRKVISSAKKKQEENMECSIFEGEDNECTSGIELTMDTQKVLNQLPDFLADFLIYRMMGYSDTDATEIINSEYNKKNKRAAYIQHLGRFLEAAPELAKQAKEILTEE